jgi:hypothetical protein
VLRALDELLWVLRREGLAIATSQAIDAARVAALVGFEDKERLRDALAAVIVDQRRDRDVFRETFDRFFAHGRAHSADLFGRLSERGFSEGELSALRELLDAIAQRSSGDAAALAPLMGSEHELDRVLRAAGIRRAIAPMSSALTAGYFAQRASEGVGIPRAASVARRLKSALIEALGDARGAALALALTEEVDRLRRRVREHIDQALARRDSTSPTATGRREDRPFSALTNAELEEVRHAVRGLAERLRGAERVRSRRALRGRIDPARTIRRSLATGGVPFSPVRKRKRRDRPKLIVLCDVSDSVRAAALFLLEFAAMSQELFSGTRSFVFVSEVADTTRLFREMPIEQALGRVFGGHLVSLAHNSNYARVLASFEDRFGDLVDKRTTVVVLGDGRTNFLGDGVDVVKRLRDKAKSLLWVCPEGRDGWGSGDSAMPRYAEAATKVIVARSARELEQAAREVVARR